MIKARQDALQGMSETGQSLSDTQLLLLCPALVEKWLDAQMRVIMPEFWFGGRLVLNSKFILVILNYVLNLCGIDLLCKSEK